MKIELTEKEAVVIADYLADVEDYPSYDAEVVIKDFVYLLNEELDKVNGDAKAFKAVRGAGYDFAKDLYDGDNFAAMTGEDSMRLALVTELIRTGKFEYSTPSLIARDVVETADAIICMLNKKK